MMADPSIDPREFIAIAGQPGAVRDELLAAMGLDLAGQPVGQGASRALLLAGGTAGKKTVAWWS